jgi:hypothetical protein
VNGPAPLAANGLAMAIRHIRPDWHLAAIQAALSQVADRPFADVALAAVLVARDPQTRFPGRLLTDGPWWPTPAPAAAALPAARCSIHLLSEPCRGCRADQIADRRPA